MAFGGMSRLIAAGGLSLAAWGQSAEIVTGQVRAVTAPAGRTAVLRLLDRARNSYTLRSAGHGYDLKVSFTVNSGGQTEYDGSWTMEEVFDPTQGLRWTAKASPSYSIVRIATNGTLYGEETGNHIPLRLQEARAALFDPIPPSERAGAATIRKSTAAFKGAQLACVLLSGSGKVASAVPGRSWEETEDCIDPQSGLLRVHSKVPGRYFSYDYTNGPRLAGHMLPRKVTITEGGKTVTEISVDSLTELPAADPSLFVPTGQMKARGRAIALTGSQTFWRVFGQGTFVPGATVDAVCVFGVVTPAGELVEAHSLQPSDPNSQAAVDAAMQMSFNQPTLGVHPQQHFVFVIEKFVTSP